MEIPVLIEPVANNCYRARSGEPLTLTAEGRTAEEALKALGALLRDRLTAGARLASLQVPDSANPWRDLAGIFKDDPYFDRWQQAIAEYRQKVEEDPDMP